MPGVQVLPLTVRFKPTWIHMLSHPDLLTSTDLKSVDFCLVPNPSQELLHVDGVAISQRVGKSATLAFA